MQLPLTSWQLMFLPTIRNLVAPYSSWLRPSYVMAHCRIESGWGILADGSFDPGIKAADYAKTGSYGLMQVEAATVQQLLSEKRITPEQVDQSAPGNSFATAVAYLDWIEQYLATKWGFKTVAYHPICEAYNEGVGNVVRGRADDPYYLKWSFSQMGYAFVDER